MVAASYRSYTNTPRTTEARERLRFINRGGVYVSAYDFDADGFDDIITGAGPGGGPHVKVFHGAKVSQGPDAAILRSFFPFDPVFLGGVNVSGGDVHGVR